MCKTLLHPGLCVYLRSIEMLLAFIGYEILVSAVFQRTCYERVSSAGSWIDSVDLATVVLKENARVIRSFGLEKVHEIPTLI